MQDHLSKILIHIYQQKFYFRKFHFIFQNFVPFCFILFYFFQKKENNFFFEIYCSQLTVDCYCYCYYSPKLHYNNCIAIQSSTASPCNTNSATTQPSCNTIRVLQYNGSTTNLPIAIQFSFSCNSMPSNYTPRLQYNFFSIAIQSQANYTLLLPYNCNTIFFSIPLFCNTIFFFQPSLL